MANRKVPIREPFAPLDISAHVAADCLHAVAFTKEADRRIIDFTRAGDQNPKCDSRRLPLKKKPDV